MRSEIAPNLAKTFEKHSVDWGSSQLTFAVTRHDLDLVHLGKFVHLPELDLVQHQRPNVVAEPVRVQLGRLEGHPGLDPVREGCVDGFVELDEHADGQGRRDLTVLFEESLI